MSIPPPVYQPLSPTRIPRPKTTQYPGRYKPTTPFKSVPPRPPAPPRTLQPVTYYKPTTPVRLSPPPSISPGGGIGKLLVKIPKAGGAAAGIALELLFPPPVGDNYFDRNPKNPPPRYKLHPPEPPTFVESPQYPFEGGQSPVLYRIEGFYTRQLPPPNHLERATAAEVWGPISSIRMEHPDGDITKFRVAITCHGRAGSPYSPSLVTVSGTNGALFDKEALPKLRIVSVKRSDNQPDTGGNLPPLNVPILSNPGNPVGTPVAAPPNVAPSPSPGAPPIIAPSPAPNNPNPDREAPPNRYPGPAPILIPNPGTTPQPDRYITPNPSPPEFFPQIDPAPTPGVGTGAPNPAPIPPNAPERPTTPQTPTTPGRPRINEPIIVNPRVNVPSLPLVGNPLLPNPLPTPTPFTPNPLTPNPLTPNPINPQPITPNPDTGDPEPRVPPIISPPTSPAPTPTPIDEIRENINRFLGPVAPALAGITALVQPERLREAANAGSCQSFAPGGCNAPIANNAQAAAANSADNGTALASIMAFLQAIQNLFLIPIKAGVELINTKLGPVISGVNGLSGFLSRAAEAAKLDKVLNAMNTVLLLHNAAMLSRNLGSTLGDLTSQALATIGIKDGDSPIDVNEILGKQANNFMSSILGAEVWAGTKTSWNKASSIIASATNLMYTMRSIFDSSREIMEWTAENTGKIGNALKRFRIVGENAYKWLPERVTVQNSFTRKLDRFREGVDGLDDAASSLSGVLGEVQSIQQEYADLQEQKQKFDKNISELTPKPGEENKPVSDAAVVAKNASKAPAEIAEVFRGEGSSTDA